MIGVAPVGRTRVSVQRVCTKGSCGTGSACFTSLTTFKRSLTVINNADPIPAVFYRSVYLYLKKKKIHVRTQWRNIIPVTNPKIVETRLLWWWGYVSEHLRSTNQRYLVASKMSHLEMEGHDNSSIPNQNSDALNIFNRSNPRSRNYKSTYNRTAASIL